MLFCFQLCEVGRVRLLFDIVFVFCLFVAVVTVIVYHNVVCVCVCVCERERERERERGVEVANVVVFGQIDSF